MLQIAVINQRANNSNGAIFEIGRIFRKAGSVTLQEPLSLACLMMGYLPGHWSGKGRAYDLYDMKGVAEKIWEWLVGTNPIISQCHEPFMHPGRSLTMNSNEKGYASTVGELHPKVAEAFGLKGRIYLMEMLLPDTRTATRKGLSFTAPSRFPATVRDISILVDEGISHGKLLSILKETSSELVEEISLIDKYKGSGLGEGKISLTYSLRYRAPDRTLTDEEVEKLHSALIEQIVLLINAKIRGK
jgi:phenylalanyl-tRNA synthetase beta chain